MTSFPTLLQGSDKSASTALLVLVPLDHRISDDLIPSTSSAVTELKSDVLNRLDSKSSSKFSPFKLAYFVREKFQPNDDPNVSPSPSIDSASVFEDDDGQCQSKTVPKNLSTEPPTNDDASPNLNRTVTVSQDPPVEPPLYVDGASVIKGDSTQNINTNVSGAALSFSGYLIPPVTHHFLSLFNIHGNRHNIKTSCCSTLCSFILLETSVSHPTDPGKRL
jgi:hypothetical protein